MELSTLENWLWEAACSIRGAVDAPKFKDYILPLIFLKRLSDVFEDEVAHLAHEFGDVKTAARLVEQDHRLVRFYLPPEARWDAIRRRSSPELSVKAVWVMPRWQRVKPLSAPLFAVAAPRCSAPAAFVRAR
ncbi:hypothetical protein E1B22_01210 [Thermaerobacter sp. FW80]|nr:type I restriction-modification system subunit M N-terminal domain-containing protein [Thermaerobacter sp. FW80]QBS36718.1 hypothetical protein E1B22_01210 [Thermaerobacter sp. FW80]